MNFILFCRQYFYFTTVDRNRNPKHYTKKKKKFFYEYNFIAKFNLRFDIVGFSQVFFFYLFYEQVVVFCRHLGAGTKLGKRVRDILWRWFCTSYVESSVAWCSSLCVCVNRRRQINLIHQPSLPTLTKQTCVTNYLNSSRSCIIFFSLYIISPHHPFISF